MADFSFADSFSKLGNDLTGSLSRRIDNELNSDFLPSPSSPRVNDDQRPVVKTADNQLGRAKYAGTGAGIIDSVPMAAWAVGGFAVVGLVAYMALK